jgi:DNA excision repair protein ERCC-6
VFPGRLGTLPAFENEFADPIKRGGYSNASPMQAQLAYRCALVLRDLINPYLLRRLKKDIKEVNRMPGKKEQVLFCRLSSRQTAMYEAFLKSDQVKQAMNGSTQMLGAITMLRKICNHPDLICPPDASSLESFIKKGSFNEADVYQHDFSDDDGTDLGENEESESAIERSGKLEVLAKILPLWKKQGHR